jgi:hypothetical protein
MQTYLINSTNETKISVFECKRKALFQVSHTKINLMRALNTFCQMGICKLKKYFELCKVWDEEDTNKEREPFIDKTLFDAVKYSDSIYNIYCDDLIDEEANGGFLERLQEDNNLLNTEIFGESANNKQVLSKRLIGVILNNYTDDVCTAFLRSSMESLEEQVHKLFHNITY